MLCYAVLRCAVLCCVMLCHAAQVPTDPPSAGPAHLAVKFFIPGKSSFFAMQQANAEAAKARQAMEDGSTVFFKGM